MDSMIRRKTITERNAALKKFGEALEVDKTRIAEYLAKNTGIPVRDKLWEVEFAANTLKTMDEETALLEGRTSIGNKALFVPYNDPIFSIGTAFGPAYIASDSDTITLKYPIDKLPDMADFLGSIFEKELEEVNFFKGSGKEFIPYALTSDDNLVMLIAHHSWVEPLERAVQASGKTVVFEGGSKNPFIVAADADLDAAVETAYKNFTLFSGQACFGSKRAFVQKKIYDDFVYGLKEKIAEAKWGDPLDQETEIGANPSRKAVDAVLNQIAKAESEGARIYGANHRDILKGSIQHTAIQPGIVYDCQPNMSIMREETFAPVLAVTPYDNEQSMLKHVIDNEYGLIATVFGNIQDDNVQRTIRDAHGFFFKNFSIVDSMKLNGKWHDPWNGYGKSAWTWRTLDDKTFVREQKPKYFVHEFSKGEA